VDRNRAGIFRSSTARADHFAHFTFRREAIHNLLPELPFDSKRRHSAAESVPRNEAL
jgi:hypothetical protein